MKLNSGAELVMKLNDTGNPELLKSLFYLRTKEWPFHMMSTDSGTVNAFCDVKLNASQSFDLIQIAIELCFEQQDSNLFTTALSLLDQCIRMANTTERPEILSRKWHDLENKVSESMDKDCNMYWDGIKSWYRV